MVKKCNIAVTRSNLPDFSSQVVVVALPDPFREMEELHGDTTVGICPKIWTKRKKWKKAKMLDTGQSKRR